MLKEIFAWVDAYGPEAVVGIAAGAAAYLLYDKSVAYYFDKRLLDHKYDKEDLAYMERRKADLQAQDFFSNITFKLNVDIPAEHFSEDPVRSEIHKAILSVLMQAYYDNMLEFVKEVDISWNRMDWSIALNNKNYETIEQFKERAVAQDIPKEAVRLFLVWFTPYIQQIYFYIKKISTMQNKNSVENTNIFLLLLELILMNTLADIQKLTIFNGNLTGMEYKGKIIEG